MGMSVQPKKQQPNAPWALGADSESDMVFGNEKMFFQIVQTTPDWVEALDMLRRARHAVLREKAAAFGKWDNKEDQRLAALLSRLNEEIKYQNTKIDRVSMFEAVRDVCGPDLYQVFLDHLHEQRKRVDEIRRDRSHQR